MFKTVEELVDNLFKQLHNYSAIVSRLPLCNIKTGELATEDVLITERLVDLLENVEAPQVCDVLNILQIYIATFKSYMKIAHERCAAYNVPYTANDVFDFALAWWMLGLNRVCRPSYLDEIQGLDKKYFAEFVSSPNDNDKTERSADFSATHKEIFDIVTQSNPDGIRFRTHDQYISADDLVLGQVLFALKDQTEAKACRDSAPPQQPPSLCDSRLPGHD